MMPKANQNPSTQKIHLKYIRLPDRITTFCDELLYRSGKVIVGRSKVNSPNAVTFDGKVVLAQDFEIVYFEISRKWFTVVKVWNTRGEHTGYYCDIVTPFRMLSDDVIGKETCFWISGSRLI